MKNTDTLKKSLADCHQRSKARLMARLRHNVEQNAQHKLSFLGGIDLIPAGNSKNERLPFGVQQVRS